MTGLNRGFTLVEVNLAIFIMAVGVLSMVSLYSLGFRESQQSRDDVASAGYADAFFAPIVAGLSATNVLWSQWRNIGSNPQEKDECDGVVPKNGWSDYVESAGSDKSLNFKVSTDWKSKADGAFNDLMNAAQSPFKGSLPNERPKCYALVATRRGGTISLGFRSCSRRDLLMSQPIYYTEIRFQGDPNQ